MPATRGPSAFESMYQFLVIVQVFLAIGIIGLVFLQHGKGADAGAAFGSGASGTVFGSRGSANFLSRATAVLATLFFVTSLSLAYLVEQGNSEASSVVDSAAAPAAEAAPEDASLVPAEDESEDAALDDIPED